jgi:hypothetical protein
VQPRAVGERLALTAEMQAEIGCTGLGHLSLPDDRRGPARCARVESQPDLAYRAGAIRFQNRGLLRRGRTAKGQRHGQGCASHLSYIGET